MNIIALYCEIDDFFRIPFENRRHNAICWFPIHRKKFFLFFFAILCKSASENVYRWIIIIFW